VIIEKQIWNKHIAQGKYYGNVLQNNKDLLVPERCVVQQSQVIFF
jgi:hypothetical protein